MLPKRRRLVKKEARVRRWTTAIKTAKISNMKLWDMIGDAPAAALLGMCKNAGKTTALNRLIREWQAAEGPGLALTSIGRDGESTDLVTGTDKPPIYLYRGMLAATAKGLLARCDVSREILAATGLFTSLGEVIIFRAQSDGFVQLAGPAIVEHMKQLGEQLRDLGAKRILLDGALSRLSPLGGIPGGVCLLSTGASLDRDMDKVIRETAHVARLLNLKREEAVEESETMNLPGAFTERQATELIRSSALKRIRQIRVRDSSCLLLKRESFEALTGRGIVFSVDKPARLGGITVNPVSAGGWRFEAGAFLEKMQEAVPVPVMDVEKE